MAEQVNIASLTINIDDVTKKSVELKKQLNSLKATQKELKDSGKETSAEYVKNEAVLKNLSKAYRDNQQFAAALDAANQDLTKTMSSQGKSTQELRDSRSQLNQISKNIIGDTEEEIALRDKLNAAIDEQTVALRGQSSEFNTAKDRIGEYKANILEAVEELRNQKEVLLETQKELEANLKAVEKGSEEYKNYQQALVVVNGELDTVNDSLGESTKGFDASNLSIEGFIDGSKKAGGAGKFFANGLKGAIAGLWGMVKAALAFIATPLGALLAVLVGAFLLIQNAMNRNEEAANNLKKAFSAFSGIVKGVMKALEPLGKFLINYVVWWFDKVEKAVFGMAEGISKALSFLGFDEAAQRVSGFTEEIRKAAENAKKLTEAELEYNKARRESRRIQLDYQKQAEKLRQIRDDETRSFEERIAANEELGKSLKKQAEEELKIAQKALDLANLRIELDGENEENLNARAEALTEIADIQERITGQESEQLTNRVQLEREKADEIKAIQEAEAQRAVELAEKKKEEAEKAAEAAVRAANYELQNYLRNNQSKIDSDKFLTEQAVEEEKNRLDLIAKERAAFQALQLEKGIIDKLEYDAAIQEIEDENQAAKDELDAERKAAKQEQEAIDFENKMTILQQQGESEFALAQKQIQRDYKAELKAAEKTGADVGLIQKKYSNYEKALEADVTEFKQMQRAQILSGVKNLFGESSAVGKAFAIAEIANTTARNATQAFGQAAVYAANPLTAPLAINANIQGGIIIALGVAQAAKTAGIKFAKGDILKGASHANGGIPFSLNGALGFEAEGGEALINKRSVAMFPHLLSAINVAGGGKKFESGSILGSSSASLPVSLFDYDLFALKTAEVVQKLPNPVVAVQEINDVNSNISAVEDLATQ